MSGKNNKRQFSTFNSVFSVPEPQASLNFSRDKNKNKKKNTQKKINKNLNKTYGS